MFERYTESARRSVFYARYEAGELGARAITPEHLLLGLTRSSQGVLGRLFAAFDASVDQIRSELHDRFKAGEKVPPSVEIPFTTAAGRVLQAASEEADACRHRDVGTEHVLLGLLRERDCAAAHLLRRHGLGLEKTRAKMLDLLGESSDDAMPSRAYVAAAVQPARDRDAGPIESGFFEDLERLVGELAAAPPGTVEASTLAARIVAEIERLKREWMS